MDTLKWFMTEITYNDFEEVKKIYVNEQVRKYLGGVIPEEHTRAKFNDIVARSNNSDSCCWVARLKTINLLG